MKNSTLFSVSKLVFFITFLSFNLLTAQEDPIDILDSYEDYTSGAREVVYVHLNKSTYIKGESIGFTAYVLDKKDKKPSLVTTNLYVSIEDEKNNVLQKKLLKVENGVASNIIELDSSFTSGYYTFKAYTNWMRNFNEQNYFIESVRIIDPKAEEYLETTTVENTIDAQFLPEGGHLLNGVINNVGVVLKDSKGYGVASVKGEVRDQKDNLVTQFEVNQFGIGKFPLLAEIGNSYKVNLSYLNKDYSFTLNEKIESIGVTMSLVNHKNKAIVSLTTNKESLKHIKNKPYSLTVHNGEKIEVLDIVFNNQLDILTVFDLEMLTPGVNILTLFNEKNQPIIERLFFNYNGIDVITSSNLSASKAGDSITMKLNFKDISAQQFNNLSVSVLPQETKSYGRHHNILSYTYLQPYVNGTIEQAKYYFTDISQEKQMELDNLLITQGWSSYDWQHIFNTNPSLNYPFEQGITLKANIHSENKASESIYMMHTSNITQPRFFKVENLEYNYFYIDSLFPVKSERLYLSTFDKKEIIQPPKLYLQSTPNEIPHLFSLRYGLNPKDNYTIATDLNKNVMQFEKINRVEELDEVIVKGELDKKKIRLKELSENAFGRITIIDENEITQHMFLSRFLQSKGYIAIDVHDASVLFVTNRSSFNPPPAIFVDNFRANMNELYLYSMDHIDYIEIEKNGTYGRNYGAIKIFTYPGSRRENNRNKKLEFKFPLTFTPEKKFYVPKYRYYNDDFYKGYGTIAWKPELVTDANGYISIKIKQPEVPVTLYIEGIANDGSFIFEEKTISLN
ncbi:hypothetical protein H8K90_04375 [Winogradskyella echinorum]|uniref:MG2 domain-containing protein n=1 Tax=Winogradskyella echinorum TaxID=538189 RepID=A0ABR6XYN1_9FLAO|nr:hypothetical protein [Winogradskyella echinorum]MBC3845602.1 hypothetical protein [Winogradskyella echinorum]MBC5749950.1 hypothetical protein [Winogradskyella echinorum]